MSKSRQDGCMPLIECTLMASESSRGRQPLALGSPRPRHRSETRKICDQQRPAKAVARKHGCCPGVLHEADAVRVFSRSADKWVDAQVVKFMEGNFVRVEYELGESWCGRTLHMHSEHLNVPTALHSSPSHCSSTSSEEEVDPECWNFLDMAKPSTTNTIAQDALACALEVLAKKGSQKARRELHILATGGDTNARAALERLGNGVVEKVPRPDFLKAQATPDTKTLQGTDPTKWAMTLNQWNKIIDECKNSDIFKEIKESKKSFEQFVSVYDINDYFVKPWTRGTGCGIALLMNPDGLDAQLMLSHAWGEDVEELQEGLNAHFEAEKIDKDTAVWFCTFAQYQVEDGEGPDIQAQLDLNPFTKVIQDSEVKMMLAVHTTRADLWERLWCVREVREAMTQKVDTSGVFSAKYVSRFKDQYNTMIDSGGSHQEGMDAAGVTVRTSRATCRDEDKPMLLRELRKHGSLNDIDKITTSFRTKAVNHIILEVANGTAAKGKPQALMDLTKQGNLQALGLLHEVAKKGNDQARDALCDALQSIAKSKKMERGWYAECFKHREPVCQLIITLLQVMANMQHQRSFDILVNHSFRSNADVIAMRYVYHSHATWRASEELASKAESFRDNVDCEAWDAQHAELPLQTLAKQGNNCALQKLAAMAKKGTKSAQQALQSLAEQWDQQALEQIQVMAKANDELTGEAARAWAHKLIEKCKESLRSFGDGVASAC